jgi:hypothetical protein
LTTKAKTKKRDDDGLGTLSRAHLLEEARYWRDEFYKLAADIMDDVRAEVLIRCVNTKTSTLTAFLDKHEKATVKA